MEISRGLLKWVCGLFFAVFNVALIATPFIYIHTRRFVDSASRAEGRVVKLVQEKDGRSSGVYFPVFVFCDSNGAEHEIRSSSGTYPPSYKVGESVTVLYTPDRPAETATLNGTFDLWGGPMIVGLVGGFGMVISLLILLVVQFLPRVPRGGDKVHVNVRVGGP